MRFLTGGQEGVLINPTSWKGNSANFGLSAVRGLLRGLVEMIAEIFRPLLCPLPRHAYLPLFYTFFIVGSVREFPELGACLGVQNSLHRFFDGLPGPGRPDLRLAHQDVVGHLLDASIFAHGALLFLAETLPQGEYNPARFLRANGPWVCGLQRTRTTSWASPGLSGWGGVTRFGPNFV